MASPVAERTGALKLPQDVEDLITWKAGESVPYLALVNTFEAISKVGGRLDKEAQFCRLFRAVMATTPGPVSQAAAVWVTVIMPAVYCV